MPTLSLAILLLLAQSPDMPPAYGKYCAACHADSASGTDRGPSLIDTRSLRSRSEAQIRDLIRYGTQGGMPAFRNLPAADLAALARTVHSWNASAYDSKPAGNPAAGKQFFDASCKGCHMVQGSGGSSGPDLSNIARELTLRELEQAVTNPNGRKGKKNGASCPGWAFCPDDPWAVVNVRLTSGQIQRGFARSRGAHDLQLQDFSGNIHLLEEGRDYTAIETEAKSYMPALQASAKQRGDLMAYLSTLGGIPVGKVTGPVAEIRASDIERVHRPKSADWPGYHGLPNANRNSLLQQIDTKNIAKLRPAWTYSLPHMGLQTTPLVVDGIMYVTAPNQVCALDGGTGREIWCYVRPRSEASKISGDAAKGAQRGAAVLGDRVFFATDDAHLIALNRLTGALMWQVYMPESLPGAYGATAAPMVVGDLVVAGVGGGDAPLLGFVAAYKATTGEQAWRFHTIPKPGEPAASTWKGKAMAMGGGATWLTGSYDVESGTLYWPTGNPYPDTDGSERLGDNLYTNCVIALDAKTGKLKWHFQFTPHDLWDWDATEPLVLVDTEFKGQPRKLLLQANRNGFFYVLDRTTGEFLLGAPFVKRLTWATGLDPKGRPVLNPAAKPTMGGTVVCPAVRGATNWYSTAYNPATKLFYVMAVEDCNSYRQAGSWFVPYNDPANPPLKVLRALDIETGKVAWEVPQVGAPESNYSGVLSTAGGLLFYGESGGTFAAADAATGKTLWHFPTGQAWKASPMTYLVKGRQHVAIAAGGSVLAFALER
jgi:PQQ-dependent dehydrogenase (methanol/ethanol family)